jgi:hypothetical protein
MQQSEQQYSRMFTLQQQQNEVVAGKPTARCKPPAQVAL